MTAKSTEQAETEWRQFDRWSPPELDAFPELDAWDGPWRDDISGREVDRVRTALLATVDVDVEASGGRRPWEGQSSGMPINRARPDRKTTKVWNLADKIRWNWLTPTFPVTRLPLPTPTRREGDPACGHGDVHMIMVDGVEGRCWEAIQAHPVTPLTWLSTLGQAEWTTAYGGSSTGLIGWDMRRRWDPATAAKGGVVAARVPFAPLVARFDEVLAGSIGHAIGIVMPNYSGERPVGWARGTDGTDPGSPVRAGDILRLSPASRAAMVAAHPSGPLRVLAEALARRGAFVHDKRTTGPADSTAARLRLSMDARWADLPDLGLRLTDFEIIKP